MSPDRADRECTSVSCTPREGHGEENAGLNPSQGDFPVIVTQRNNFPQRLFTKRANCEAGACHSLSTALYSMVGHAHLFPFDNEVVRFWRTDPGLEKIIFHKYVFDGDDSKYGPFTGGL